MTTRSSEAAAASMREADPAWRSRDLPPSADQAYQMAKLTSWLDRGGNIDDTRISPKGHSILITAVINNHESLVAELLKRGASVDIYAQGKTALHFAVLLVRTRHSLKQPVRPLSHHTCMAVCVCACCLAGPFQLLSAAAASWCLGQSSCSAG